MTLDRMHTYIAWALVAGKTALFFFVSWSVIDFTTNKHLNIRCILATNAVFVPVVWLLRDKLYISNVTAGV